METEQTSKIKVLPNIKPVRQLQELPSIDKDEYISPSQKTVNLLPLWRTIRRKAVLIAGVTSLATVAAVLLLGKEPPLYQGDFQLLVEPITNEAKSNDPSAITRSEKQAPNFSVDYPTQVAILQSQKMLSEIVQQVQTQYPSFNYGELRQGLMVGRVGKTPSDNTKIIQVIYQNQNPKIAQFVLEKIAEKYLKYSLDERRSRIGEGVKFIDSQTPALQKRVDNLQSQLQILQRQYKLTDPKQNGEELFAQTRQIAGEKSAVQRQLQELSSLYTNLNKQLNLTPDEAIAASALSEDPIYQEAVGKLREVEGQIAVESTRFTAESPPMQALDAKRQSLIALLNQESQRIVGQQGLNTSKNFQGLGSQSTVRLELIKQLVDTRNQIQTLQVRNQALAQSKDAFEQAARQFPDVARQYTAIQQQLELTTQTLNQLLSQRETLRVESAQNQVPWELVSPPQIAINAVGLPISEKGDSSKKLMMVVMLGLALSIVAAVLLEKYYDIFYTSEDLKDAVKLPVLGEIPLDKSIQESPDATALEGDLAGNEEVSGNNYFLKAFDSLYANIRFLFSDQPVRSLTICSACDGDGKSTIALHIAETAASIGQRVLLVDANFHEPEIHNMLGITNYKGLSDLLSKKMAPNEAIMRSPQVDNLFVLTSGQALPNSSKILGSAQMQYLMENFQATFDLVVYDTPHLSAAMDANFIATHTDGILMVAGINKTKQSTLKQVINQLNTFGLQTLGVVANYVTKSPSKLNSL
ncbi:MAG TPA: polysaccharide biosynthesis tyrosine autokinase [Oculatellaceae cyanobacterium]|jgi:capsular exopolysaccharide synthesis family protein